MFWLVATAASLSAPAPTNRIRWFTPDDMPAYHQIAGVTRMVRVRVTVRPNGSSQYCEIENSDGDPKLAVFTCELIMKRAKFDHARWTDGSPAVGVFRETVTWAVGSPPPPKLKRGDLELTVDRLPRRERSPAFVRVMFAVDTSGRPSSCASEPPSLPALTNNPELVPLACEELMRTYTAVPAKDETGRLVPSVQNALVKFIKKKRAKGNWAVRPL